MVSGSDQVTVVTVLVLVMTVAVTLVLICCDDGVADDIGIGGDRGVVSSDDD